VRQKCEGMPKEKLLLD
jgi:hypothetical protein